MLTTISSTANDKFGVDPMKTREKPVRKAYRSPTEDAAIGHIMREWRREQKRQRDHDAYLLRKATWEATHPGMTYELRPRYNIQVWKDGDR